MEQLTDRERELVALGAALASNCVPCIEQHIRKARETGLSDAQVLDAIHLADKIRQVPVRNVFKAALSACGGAMADAASTADACAGPGRRGAPCC